MKLFVLSFLLLIASSFSAPILVDITLQGVANLVENSEVQSPYCLSEFSSLGLLVLPSQNYSAVFVLTSDSVVNYTVNATAADGKVISWTATNATGTLKNKANVEYQVLCNECGETTVQILFSFTGADNETLTVPVFLAVACNSWAASKNFGLEITEVEPVESTLVDQSTANYPWCSPVQPATFALPYSIDEVALEVSVEVNATYTLTITQDPQGIAQVNTSIPLKGNFTAKHVLNMTISFTCQKCGQAATEFSLEMKSGNATETVVIYAVKQCSAAAPTGYPFSFNIEAATTSVVSKNAVQYPYCTSQFDIIPPVYPQAGPLAFEYELTGAAADYVIKSQVAPADVLAITNYSIPTNGTFKPSDAFHEVMVEVECNKCGFANVTFTIALTNHTNGTKNNALDVVIPQSFVCNEPAPATNSQFQLEANLCVGTIPLVQDSETLYPFCSKDQVTITIDEPVDQISLQMTNDNKNATYALTIASSREATLKPSFNISAQGNLTTEWLPFTLNLECLESGSAMVTLNFAINAPKSTNQTYSVNFWKNCGGNPAPPKPNKSKKTLTIVLAVVIPVGVILAIAVGIVCFVKKGKSDPHEKQPLVQHNH